MSLTDKNLAALLDESAFTAKVCFQGGDHTRAPRYTYVSNDASLKEGDVVVVPVTRNGIHPRPVVISIWGEGVGLVVGTVVAVDKELDIPADCDIELRWIAAKLDLAPAAELLMRNAMMTSLVSKAYRKNVRSSFAANILDRLGSDDARSLKKLLNKE